MPERVYICGPAAKVVRGGARAVHGHDVDAIALGNFVLVIEPRPEGEDLARLLRHEDRHVDQQAREAPWWAKRLPKKIRVWLGAPRFYEKYLVEYRLHGYEWNKYEIEARAAEAG